MENNQAWMAYQLIIECMKMPKVLQHLIHARHYKLLFDVNRSILTDS